MMTPSETQLVFTTGPFFKLFTTLIITTLVAADQRNHTVATSHASPSADLIGIESLQRNFYVQSPPEPTVNASFRCPEKFGYFPDLRDCSKYFVCVFGDPLHETCTGGLYFSSELQTCDWPQNVDCSQGPRNSYTGANDILYTQEKANSVNSSTRAANLEGDYVTEPPPSASYDNDLDGAQFDESIASFVDTNGDVYVHDDPGGLYPLIQRSSSISDHSKTLFNLAPLPDTTNQIKKSKTKVKVDKHHLESKQPQQTGCTNCEEKQYVLEAKSPKPSYPEHLRPRLNIVKKQLKEFEPRHEHREPDSLFDRKNETTTTTTTAATSAKSSNTETITFVVDTNTDDYLSVRDLWTNSPQRKSSRKATIFDDERQINRLFASPQPASTSKLNPSFKQRRSQMTLTDDSIMQVFRGNAKANYHEPTTTGNRRKYLLHSTFSMPLYSLHSSRPVKSTTTATIPSAVDSNRLPNTTNSSSGKSDNTQQIIFYSYRNQAHSNQPSTAKINNNNNNLPPAIIAEPSILTKEDLQPEVFTIPSEKLLWKNSTIKQLSKYSRLLAKTKSNGTSGTERRRLETKKKPRLNEYLLDDEFESKMTTTTVATVTMAPMTTTLFPELFSTNQSSLKIEASNYVMPHIQQCDPQLNCRLPKCFCSGTKPPNNLSLKQTPQMIVLAFDDAVNDINFPLFEEIFSPSRKNPNGCPIRGTFFVSHEWTDYSKVQTLYARGHEVASHSITHSFGERFSTNDWYREIAGQREFIHRYAGVPRTEIRGMRAPFLQIGGDQQFQMLMDANFTYDSSISVFDNSPPLWPYTLDFAIQHECMITPCPSRSYPGLWEIGLIMWQDLLGGGRCTMGNSCTSPSDESGVYRLIMSNFKRHYETNRAPFGLYYQSGWFTTAHHKAGFLRFVDEVLQRGDVYFVTNWQLLNWMQNPASLPQMAHFEPWKCRKARKVADECRTPNICHVKFHKRNSVGSRYFKTCQKCPLDYPWISNVDQLLA